MKTYVIEYTVRSNGMDYPMYKEIHRAANSDHAVKQLRQMYKDPIKKITHVERCLSFSDYREYEESLELEPEHNPYDEYDN